MVTKQPFERHNGEVWGSYVTEGGQRIWGVSVEHVPDRWPIETIVAQLTQGDRTAVVHAQWYIGDERIVAGLAGLLARLEGSEALQVAQVLALSRSKSATAELLRLLEALEPHLGVASVDGEQEAVQMKGIAEVVASIAIQTGDISHCERILPLLLAAPLDSVRLVAARSLTRVLAEPDVGKSESLWAMATAALHDPDPNVFAMLATATKDMASGVVLERCELLLGSGDEISRGIAIRLLASRTDDPHGRQLLSIALGHESVLHLQCDIAMAIAGVGLERDRVMDVAQRALADASPLMRQSGAMLLRRLPRELVDGLASSALADEPDPRIREILVRLVTPTT
jgi:hypothetical protein